MYWRYWMCLKCDKWYYVTLWMVSMPIISVLNYIVIIVSNVQEVSLKRHDARFLTKFSSLKLVFTWLSYLNSYTNTILLYPFIPSVVVMAKGSFLEWRAWITIPMFKSYLNDLRTFMSTIYLSSCNSIEIFFVLLRAVSLLYWCCLRWQEDT